MSQDSLKALRRGKNFETSDYVHNIGQAGIVQLPAEAGDPVQAGSYFFVLKPVLSLPPPVFLLYSLQKYRKCRTPSIIRAAFDRITPGVWYFDLSNNRTCCDDMAKLKYMIV